jgi:hypothetical protein
MSLALILTIARSAGALLATILQARGKAEASDVVVNVLDASEKAARDIIDRLKGTVDSDESTPLTAEDVQAAVLAAMAEVDALIAEAEASLESRKS